MGIILGIPFIDAFADIIFCLQDREDVMNASQIGCLECTSLEALLHPTSCLCSSRILDFLQPNIPHEMLSQAGMLKAICKLFCFAAELCFHYAAYFSAFDS